MNALIALIDPAHDHHELAHARFEKFDPARLPSAAQIPDTYILALAVSNGGPLATFDRRLDTSAALGGREALLDRLDSAGRQAPS